LGSARIIALRPPGSLSYTDVPEETTIKRLLKKQQQNQHCTERRDPTTKALIPQHQMQNS
jgi:hypothetical protein